MKTIIITKGTVVSGGLSFRADLVLRDGLIRAVLPSGEGRDSLLSEGMGRDEDSIVIDADIVIFDEDVNVSEVIVGGMRFSGL